MSDPLWRPARFLFGVVTADGLLDQAETIAPGNIAVITSIAGSYIGDGLTPNTFFVSANGVEIWTVQTSSVFVAPAQPSLPLFCLVFPGEVITIGGNGGTLAGQASLTVSGRYYSAVQL